MKSSFEEVLSNRVIKSLLFLFWGGVLVLTILGYAKYPGSGYVYICFTIVSNLLLYSGFRKNAIFFDTFLGIFFWLGFWLKLTFRISFVDGVFHESVGYFDGSAAAYDRGLFVVFCGLSGFLLARYIRGRFFRYPERIEGLAQKGLFEVYLNNRRSIWIGFIAVILAVGVSNAYFGIYQRGGITQTVLPLGLNGVYKWLLLFGLTSITTLLVRFEFEIKGRTTVPPVLLGIFETLISNVSLLSRGMILNGSALIIGILKALRPYSIKADLRFFLVTGVIFSALFIGSVYAVNYFRAITYASIPVAEMKIPSVAEKFRLAAARLKTAQSMTAPLFIDRWVGMEGALALSSQPNLGWEMWKAAWQESYDENALSFYDSIVESYYVKHTDTSKYHFISLPGIIAFFFYPGSFLFLFASMLTLGLAAAALEVFTFRIAGQNLILCALIAQVIAFRFASFGYVPKQSYLLFGTIILNVLIIYVADKLLTRFYRRQSPVVPA